MPTINPACARVPLFPSARVRPRTYIRACVRVVYASIFTLTRECECERSCASVSTCMCDLCRLPDINIERVHRWVRATVLLAPSVVPSSASLVLSLSLPPPHFRATRSVLLSPQPPARFLSSSTHYLSLSLSRSSSIPPSPSDRVHSFPLHGPPSLHSRHPIPDTRYLIMLNASGFCGRIMRPRCPRTLFRSLHCFPSLFHVLFHSCTRSTLLHPAVVSASRFLSRRKDSRARRNSMHRKQERL